MFSDLIHTLLTIWRFKFRLSPHIRQVTIEDLPQLIELDRKVFPDPKQQANQENLRKRIVTSPRTCLVLVAPKGKIVGALYARMINAEEYLSYNDLPTWEQMANNGDFTSPRKPDALYVVGIAGLPGMNASKFLEPAIARIAVKLGISRVWAGSRITGYCKHTEIPVEQYIHLLREDGWPLDPTLRSLIRGASIGHIRLLKPIRVMKNSFPDSESLDYAALVEGKVPFYAWPGRNFWGYVLEQLLLHF